MASQGEKSQLRFESIGYWSEIKLDILRNYEAAYSAILAKQRRFSHVYIDAFAGTGYHLSRESGKLVPGSPINALWVKPPFCEYFPR